VGKYQLTAGELVAVAGEGFEVEMPADLREAVALAQNKSTLSAASISTSVHSVSPE
jgi:hypothetical protein